jgi:hypothetical protein
MPDPTTRTVVMGHMERHHGFYALGFDHGARVVRHLHDAHGVDAPAEDTTDARAARARLHHEAHGCTVTDDGRILHPRSITRNVVGGPIPIADGPSAPSITER